MSRFLAQLLDSAARSPHAMTSGEPRNPVRRTWPQVHETALAMAAALRRDGIGPGAAVGVLAGEPAAIAPAVQAVWLLGGSVTMLHQPTLRTDLTAWARDTVAVLTMIDARLVLLGSPFEGLAVVLAERGIPHRTIGSLTGAGTIHAGTGGTGTAAGERGPNPPIAPDTGTAGAADETVGESGPNLLIAPGVGTAGVVDEVVGERGPNSPVVPDADVAGEHDAALLQLTSGSTAEPKAVRITHGNLHANITAMREAAALDVERDVMVSWLPLFHDMGMVGFLTLPMVTGTELVSVTPPDFLGRPLLWAELISKYGGTVTAAPNFAYAVLARQLARADGPLDLSSLRVALNGAEPIDPAVVAAFIASGARFGLRPGSVLCAYGMAETALGVSFTRPGTGLEVDEIDADELESRRRAIPGQGRTFPKLGPPLPGIEVRVVAEGPLAGPNIGAEAPIAGPGSGGAAPLSSGRPGPSTSGPGRVLGEREVGILQLRGPSVTPGYLTVDGPVAAQDADGWLDTGDEGYLTAGQVVVCGRRKDTIIMAGRNIYPTDIERAAAEAADVRAGNAVAARLMAVDGARRETFAVVVESRKAGDAEAEAAIRKEVVSRVVTAVGVRPAEVVVLAPGTLPKTPSGKLRRSATGALLRQR